MYTRILLADDHSLFRCGLRQLLSQEPQYEVVAEAEDGQEALDQLRRLDVDVVLSDVVMPVLNGIELARQVTAAYPRVRVVMVSGHLQAQQIDDALRAGAVGYVSKASAPNHLSEAIRAAIRGRSYLSPSVTDAMIHRYVRGGSGNGSHAATLVGEPTRNGQRDSGGLAVALNGRTLTPREREVLQMLSEGHPSKSIASRLCVSVKTVDTHRAALMRKLDLPSIAHLTKYAVREGITTLEY